MAHRPLTHEELNVLRGFAKEYGRYWKATLRDMWMGYGDTHPRASLLRVLRNELGPSWLVNFRLPRA